MGNLSAAVDGAILLLCRQGPADELTRQCVAVLGVAEADVPALLEAARQRLTAVADGVKADERQTALARMNEIYGLCMRAALPVPEGGQNEGHNAYGKALAAQRVINQLLGLYPNSPRGTAIPDDDEAEPGPQAPRRPRDAAAEELYDAVDAHLDGLGLIGQPERAATASYVEIIAAAGAAVRQLRLDLAAATDPSAAQPPSVPAPPAPARPLRHGPKPPPPPATPPPRRRKAR